MPTLAETLATERTRRRLEELEKMPMDVFLNSNRLKMEHTIRTTKNWPRKADPDHRVEPARRTSGWLLPMLRATESILWGRWYWHQLAWAFLRLPDTPIPPIHFLGAPDPNCREMLEHSLDSITGYRGSWQGWSSWTNFDYFLDWLLFAFGHHAEEPREPERHAYDRLYQTFCLEAMLAWPYDYFGDILAENKFGTSLGFYPTPMDVTKMMISMTMGKPHDRPWELDPDPRVATFNEPCIGTGRMALQASNYTVHIHGMDINETCVKATIVNSFCYAPWMVQPFSFLRPHREESTAEPQPPPVPGITWNRTRRGNLQGEFALA